MLAKNIREQILERAKEKNLSILALEGKASLKSGTVGNIIANRSLNPKIETLAAIARVLDCTLDALISDPNDPKLQTQKKEQKDCEFTFTLFREVVQRALNHLETKKPDVTLNQIMLAIKEAYMFFFTKRNKTVDSELVEWLIDKNDNQ